MKHPEPQPIVVLISGRGSNMRALIDDSCDPAAGYRVAAVISNKAAAPGLEIAAAAGVPTQVVEAGAQPDRSAYDRRLSAAIDTYRPVLIVLAGFMRILSAEFVARHAGRLMNIHPSLLPKYPGLHTHRRALEAGDAEHGVTVHFVTPELDGGPGIVQARVAVRPDDDEATLAARVLAQETRIYPQAVRWFCSGRLSHRGDRAWFDGEALAAPLRSEVAA